MTFIGLAVSIPAVAMRSGGGGTPAPTPAPTLSSPTASPFGTDAMTGTVTTDQSSGTLYRYISTSATPPSATNLKNGTGANAFGSQSVSASGAQNISQSGLAANTAYYAHYLHTTTGGDSNIVTSASFTTYAIKLVAMGDSITAGSGLYSDIYSAANPSIAYAKVAQSGAGVGNSTQPADGGNTLWQKRQLAIDAAPSLITILIGTNDLGTANQSTWLSELYGLVTWFRNARPGVKVVICGLLSKSVADYRTARNAVNALLRAAVGNEIDGYIPIGEHPIAQSDAAGSDTTWFSDGTHPTAANHTIMAQIYGAGVDGWLKGQTGSQVAQFTFGDDVNVAPSSGNYTGEAILSGMGPTQTTSATLSGTGTFRRGHQMALGTAALTGLVNGDTIQVQDAAASTSGTNVDNVVTSGSISDTYRIATTSATPMTVEALAVNFGGRSPNNAGGSSTQTWSNIALKQGYMVLQIYSWNNGSTIRNCTQVAITPTGGGSTTTSTTELITRSGKFQAMGIAVPADGNYDVVFTFAANTFAVNINAAVLKGPVTSTPTQTQVKAAASTNSPYTSWTAQNVPANGMALFLTAIGSISSSNCSVSSATDLVASPYDDTSAANEDWRLEIAYSTASITSPQVSFTPTTTSLQGFALSFSQ